MSEDDKNAGSYTLEEGYSRTMLKKSRRQLEIIADLLSTKTDEDPLHTRVITLLCDSFSANYHLWRILQINLDYNLFYDEEVKQNYILVPEKDLVMLEQAVIARTFTSLELSKLHYSLRFH